jgi:hypothetical protein
MLTVVFRSPFCTTDITELIAASTSDVVATLVFFYHHFALLALSVVEVALKKHELVLLALAFMI